MASFVFSDNFTKGELQMANTHLCGSIYDSKAAGRCPFLLFADKPGMKHGYRTLKLYDVYCLANGRCRSMGNIASFTGNSPTWCPRRKELEQHE